MGIIKMVITSNPATQEQCLHLDKGPKGGLQKRIKWWN